MGSVALGARVFLAVVFAVAAAGKLADQPGTRATLRDFHLPHKSLRALALALPLAELAVATAIVVQQSARWGAVAVLGLLTLFASAIMLAMARGEAPDCHCFGQLASRPAGRGTLIRNALLAVPAGFVAGYGPGRSLNALLPGSSATEAIALGGVCVSIALGLASVQLYLRGRHLARELARAKETIGAFPVGLPIGARAPRFSLNDLDGGTIALDELLDRRRPVALVFASPDCGPCEAMFPKLAGWQRRLAHRMTIVIATTGSAAQLRPVADAHGLQNVALDRHAEVFESYHASATPSAVIVTADGNIGSPTHSTTVVVEALIRNALEHTPPTAGQQHDGTTVGPTRILQWEGAAR